MATHCWCERDYVRGRCPLHGTMPDPNLAVSRAADETFAHAVSAADATSTAALAANPLLAIIGNLVFMFTGTVAEIPSGWHLCDGTGGTVDLRDKFVVGVKEDSAGTAKTNVTGSLLQSGGEATHVLGGTEIPAHTHTIGAGVEGGGANYGSFVVGTTSSATQVSSIADGGNTPAVAHNNVPPFFALCFIQYVGT